MSQDPHPVRSWRFVTGHNTHHPVMTGHFCQSVFGPAAHSEVEKGQKSVYARRGASIRDMDEDTYQTGHLPANLALPPAVRADEVTGHSRLIRPSGS